MWYLFPADVLFDTKRKQLATFDMPFHSSYETSRSSQGLLCNATVAFGQIMKYYVAGYSRNCMYIQLLANRLYVQRLTRLVSPLTDWLQLLSSTRLQGGVAQMVEQR